MDVVGYGMRSNDWRPRWPTPRSTRHPPHPFQHAPHKQSITRVGGDKVSEDYTPEEVIVDARMEYTGPVFMDELQRLVRDATKGAGSVEEIAEVVAGEEGGEG